MKWLKIFKWNCVAALSNWNHFKVKISVANGQFCVKTMWKSCFCIYIVQSIWKSKSLTDWMNFSYQNYATLAEYSLFVFWAEILRGGILPTNLLWLIYDLWVWQSILNPNQVSYFLFRFSAKLNIWLKYVWQNCILAMCCPSICPCVCILRRENFRPWFQ